VFTLAKFVGKMPAMAAMVILALASLGKTTKGCFYLLLCHPRKPRQVSLLPPSMAFVKQNFAYVERMLEYQQARQMPAPQHFKHRP
jgi:hypothetical protein